MNRFLKQFSKRKYVLIWFFEHFFITIIVVSLIYKFIFILYCTKVDRDIEITKNCSGIRVTYIDAYQKKKKKKPANILNK